MPADADVHCCTRRSMDGVVVEGRGGGVVEMVVEGIAQKGREGASNAG